MNKKILILFFCMILVPIVYARDVDVKQVKVYVNNERITDADETGGNFYTYRGDTIDIFMTLLNNRINSTDAKIYARFKGINDGDDIQKNFDYFSIPGGYDKTKTFSFVIPEGAIYDTYTLSFEIYYKNNISGEERYLIEYDVTVKKKIVAGEDPETILIKGWYNNITTMNIELKNALNNCFDYANTNKLLVDNLSTTKEQYGNLKNQYDDTMNSKNEAEKLVTDKNNQIVNLNNEISNKNAQISNMKPIDVCTNELNAAVDAKVSSFQSGALVAIILGLVGWFIWKNKKAKSSAGESWNKNYQP